MSEKKLLLNTLGRNFAEYFRNSFLATLSSKFVIKSKEVRPPFGRFQQNVTLTSQSGFDLLQHIRHYWPAYT